MGAASWHDGILQALLIGLVVQIVVYILWVFCAFLWAAWKGRMARLTTGESMAESDVEMGTVNVAEGAAISGVEDDDKLEDTENTAETSRGSTPKIPTADHLSKAQCENLSKDVKRRASVSGVVDVSTPQQV